MLTSNYKKLFNAGRKQYTYKVSGSSSSYTYYYTVAFRLEDENVVTDSEGNTSSVVAYRSSTDTSTSSSYVNATSYAYHFQLKALSTASLSYPGLVRLNPTSYPLSNYSATYRLAIGYESGDITEDTNVIDNSFEGSFNTNYTTDVDKLTLSINNTSESTETINCIGIYAPLVMNVDTSGSADPAPSANAKYVLLAVYKFANTTLESGDAIEIEIKGNMQ